MKNRTILISLVSFFLSNVLYSDVTNFKTNLDSNDINFNRSVLNLKSTSRYLDAESEENIYEKSVKVFSNCNINYLSLYLEDLTLFKGLDIAVVDLLGNQLYAGTINKDFYQIDMSKWGNFSIGVIEIYDALGNCVFKRKIYQ